MTKFLKERLRAQVAMKSLMLGAGIWLLLHGTAIAQVTSCSDEIRADWPTPPITHPSLADRLGIDYLISQYNSALATQDEVTLSELLDKKISYEVCSPGGSLGNVQNFRTTIRDEVIAYHKKAWGGFDINVLTVQHLWSGLVLNETGPDQVEGKFTRLTTIQSSYSPPQNDYIATIKATFEKDEMGNWRFLSFLLISAIPDRGPGIGTTAR